MTAVEHVGSLPLPEVSVLIVAYQARAFIADCLDAVMAATQTVRVEVLLIDNGSDRCGEWVSASYPHVTVIPEQGNIGFGPGNNVLARHARAPLLLLLNPDMVLSPGSLDRLVEASHVKPNAAAWGGITLSPDGDADMANHLRLPTLGALARRLLFMGERAVPAAHLSRHEFVQVEVITGGLALINRAFWDWAGGFDESFFLYAEESDLFFRAKQAGWQVWRTCRATARHNTGGGDHLASGRLLFQASGLAHYLHKNWPAVPARCGALLIWIIAVERYVAGRLFGRFFPSVGRLGKAYSLVATRPGCWFRGYRSRYWRTLLGAAGLRV